MKLRKTALLRQKVRRLQSAYPMMDQPLIGMYAPGVRRPRGEGFENTPEWFRDHYQDDINDFDGTMIVFFCFEIEVQLCQRSGSFDSGKYYKFYLIRLIT